MRRSSAANAYGYSSRVPRLNVPQMLEIEFAPRARERVPRREMFHTLFRLGFRERNRQRAVDRSTPRRVIARAPSGGGIVQKSRLVGRLETLPCANASNRNRAVSTSSGFRRADCDAEKGMLGVANRPPERFMAIPRTASSVGVSGGRRAAICCSSLAEKSVSEKAAYADFFGFGFFAKRARRQTRAGLASRRAEPVSPPRARPDGHGLGPASQVARVVHARRVVVLRGADVGVGSAAPAETRFGSRRRRVAETPSSPSSPSAPPGVFASRAEETACPCGPGGGLRPHETHARRCLIGDGVAGRTRPRGGVEFRGSNRVAVSAVSSAPTPVLGLVFAFPPRRAPWARRRVRRRRRSRHRAVEDERIIERYVAGDGGDRRRDASVLVGVEEGPATRACARAVRAWHPANPRPAARSGWGRCPQSPSRAEDARPRARAC